MKLNSRTIGLSLIALLAAAGGAAIWALPAAGAGAANPPAQGSRQIDFVKDVQPILNDSCVECHNAKKHKANLRLDNRADAFAGGDGGKSIEPGESKKSLLVVRILGQGEDEAMPFKKPKLSQAQIDTLVTWIDQGASWPASADGAVAKTETHWAYVKPERPALPAIKDPKHAAWVRNPIDAFVVARLEKEGLTPSPEAPREMLIRRVTLDLIGLPPTPAEVDAFLKDASPDAYEKVVDRLLASPHYGERWASRWLDLARYADSNGFEKDRPRSMWPWRDWVINSLNADMPFDEFTIEQIAGDLMPNATRDQLIATGFHRNTMLNEEGGVDPEEYRYYALVDRVNTTATVWLGSTLNCSQCHNHKFDPFTQKDYYQLLAFFNSTTEETSKGGGTDPKDTSAALKVESPEAKPLEQQVAKLRETLATPVLTPELAKAEEAWEKQASAAPVWTPLEVTTAKSANGASLTISPDGSVLVSGTNPATDVYTLTARTPLERITAIRLEALPDPSLPGKGPGRAGNGNFVLNHLQVTASPAGDKYPAAAAVKFQAASADFTQDTWSVSRAIAAKIDPKGGWAVVPKTGVPHTAVFETARDVAYPGGAAMTLTLSQLDAEAPEHTLGHFRLSVTSAARPVRAGGMPAAIAKLIALPRAKRTELQKVQLTSYYLEDAPESERVREQIVDLEKRIAKLPQTTLVMRELPRPRDTFIHARGAYLTPTDKVEPGIPAIFIKHGGAAASPATQPDAHRLNRLDLARWLVSSDNPLTARVAVNRFWEQYFGRGIVLTSEDFGTQGEAPTYPDVLDYLATEFVAQHWSMKAIHRLIVTSATYRQSSDVTPALLEKDPLNRMLARGPRFRLPSEAIRDQALAVSGLLSPKVNGPSVFPPQPDNIWNSPYSGERWITSEGEDRYRRGVYTFLRRSAPYPSFMAFDGTAHEAVCTRRSRTNTPLQALTTLNDPVYVQAAAAMARRVVREAGPAAPERAAYALRLCVARTPEPREVERVVALYQQELAHYQQDVKAAQVLASTGGADASPAAAVPEMAAWTVVSNVLLNLDETLTKE